MKIHFCLTDGRPWYKQVVSGVFIFLAIAIYSPFAFLAVAIPYFFAITLGFWEFVFEVANIISMTLVAFAVVVLVMMVYGWAKD